MADKRKNTVEDKHRISRTLWTLYCLFLVASLAVIVKIFYIQNIWEPDRQTIAEFLPDNRKEIVRPERGDILDCNGKLLATSTPLYTVRMDCHIQKSELLDKKIKVGKDSITERDWRNMAMEMCRQMPEIIQDGRTAEDFYNLIISNTTPAISRNASVSRVNAPMMKSMVPPDTPGMTLAPPMQKPTEKWYRSSRNFKNVRTGTPLSGMELISFGRKWQSRQDSNLI